MIKRFAMFLLVITAVPAIVLSLPVWADPEKTDLSMTVKLTGTAFEGSIKVWDYVTNDGIAGYHNQNIQEGWMKTLSAEQRTENMYISVAANNQSDVYCQIKGTSGHDIPLMDEEGEPISALTIEVTEANAKVSACAIVLGVQSPIEQKLLNIFVLESPLTSPFTLTMNHYEQDGEAIGSPISLNVPAGGDEDFVQNELPSTAYYSTISHGSRVCTYTSGSDPSFIYAPAAGNSASVYVEVKDNACTLDPSTTPPPPPGQPITTCAELQNIRNNLAGDYYLANNLNGCNNVTITGVFTGSLNGNHMLISNIAITKNSISGQAGPHVALFEEIGSGGEVYDMAFNTATLSGETDGLKALIAAFTMSAKISNITIDNITIKDGTKDNATGSIVGRSQGVEGAPTVLSNVHVNGANIVRNGFAGGLIGRVWSWTTIDKSSVRGFTSGGGKKDCQGNDCAVGGLIGAIDGESMDARFAVVINESSAKGTIKTKYHAGGLIGYIDQTKAATVDIRNSYAIVDIPEVDKKAGGLIGSAVEDGSDNIQLNYTYAAGKVVNSGASKGIIGKEEGKTSKRVYSSSGASLWDYEATGQLKSGDNNVSSSSTTQQMTSGNPTQAPFNSGWNTNIWVFKSGQYPYLKSDPEYNP